MTKLRVFLADDHPVYRVGLKTLFKNSGDIDLVGEAADGAEALVLLRNNIPDVLLVDLMMPGMNGLELIRIVREEEIACKIIVISQIVEDEWLKQLVGYDIDGHILKSDSLDEMMRALAAMKRDERFFSHQISQHLYRMLRSQTPSASKSATPFSEISPREKEVITLLAQGQTVKEMALALQCSENTIKSHKANLMRKLGASNSTEVASWAHKNGLVT